MSPFPDYPVPVDELQRLRSLERHDLHDHRKDPHLDRLLELATELLDAPIGLISLIDADRQWFNARQGIDLEETPRKMAFCAHAIAGSGVLVVPDALEDPRFNTNPLALEEPRIRFYAGAPLTSEDGHNLGTLCVIDRKPRQLSDQQIHLLEPTALRRPYYAEFGWVAAPDSGVNLPNKDTVWTSGGGSLTPETPVTLTWDNGEGLVFERTITVDEHYMFSVEQKVRNAGAEQVTLFPYGLLSRGGGRRWRPPAGFKHSGQNFALGALG